MEQSKSEGRNTLKGWNNVRQKTGKIRTYIFGQEKVRRKREK